MTSLEAFVPARPLTGQDARTLLLSALGGALEFYDFVIFVFFTAVIGKQFFPADIPDWLRQVQAFGIFAAGYLARPLGGVVMAHFGDKVGRKRMFTLSVFLMAVPTLLVGLLPTYQVLGYGAPLALLALRILQGAAIGGEVPGAWVFVSEHVPYKRMGLACGLLTGGLTSGILLGSLAATAVNTWYTPAEVLDFGWRLPFLFGGLLGLLAVYLRSYLEETPVFAEISRLKQTEGVPLKAVLKDHRLASVVAVIITWVLTAAVVVVILMTPTLLSKLHGLPQSQVLPANSMATLTLSVACVVVGLLTDRFGPVKVLTVGAIGLSLSTYLLYVGAASSPQHLVALYGLAGAFVGTIAVVPIIMVRSFPAAVRFSGISFSYNISYAVFGGITPMVIPLMLAVNPMSPPYYVAIAAIGGTLAVLATSRILDRQRTAEE